MAEEEKAEVEFEQGEVSKEQLAEIEAGEWYTIPQVANTFKFSRAWITRLVQNGKIKAIKPIGRQWRIPKSEMVRMSTEKSTPPLPRKEPAKPITEIRVPAEKADKVAPELSKEKPKRTPGLFDFMFRDKEE